MNICRLVGVAVAVRRVLRGEDKPSMSRDSWHSCGPDSRRAAGAAEPAAVGTLLVGSVDDGTRVPFCTQIT